MKCPKCGFENSEENKFCPNCGNKLTSGNEHSSSKIPSGFSSNGWQKDMLKIAKPRTIIIVAVVIILIIILYLTHVICFHNWQPATCTLPETCSICKRTRGEPLGHMYSEATCTEPETCTICGQVRGRKLGHLVENWEIVNNASCTAEGEEEGVCSRCGEMITRIIDKIPHSYGDWVVDSPATCTDKGIQHRSCIICNYEQKYTIAATGHTFNDWVIDSPESCTKDGTKHRNCTKCGFAETSSIAATGHNWSGWVRTLEPTIAKEGIETRTCSYCNEEEHKDIPKLDAEEVLKKHLLTELYEFNEFCVNNGFTPYYRVVVYYTSSWGPYSMGWNEGWEGGSDIRIMNWDQAMEYGYSDPKSCTGVLILKISQIDTVNNTVTVWINNDYTDLDRCFGSWILAKPIHKIYLHDGGIEE